MANNDKYVVAFGYIAQDGEFHIMASRLLWFRTAKREMKRWSPRTHDIVDQPFLMRDPKRRRRES